MKKILLALTTISVMAIGGDYEDGLAAYNKGDYKKAFTLVKKAADNGDKWAQKDLAILYEYGEGVKQDYKKAAEYNQKSADQGVSQAQFNLGLTYEKGQGVKQDYKKAAELYQKAADQGDAFFSV